MARSFGEEEGQQQQAVDLESLEDNKKLASPPVRVNGWRRRDETRLQTLSSELLAA